MVDYVLDFLNIFQGLRKSIVMLLLMTIGVVLILKGYLNGGQFVDLLKATVISYFGANSVEHFSAMVQAHLESKSPKDTSPPKSVAKEVIVETEEGD